MYGYAELLTDEQKVYLDAIEDENVKVIVVDAKAGTGKTTLAVMMAHLRQKGLLYTFNPTEEDKMGFRPGNQNLKESSYLGPLKDALTEMNLVPDKQLFYEDENGEEYGSDEAWIRAKSHTFVRGTNIKEVTAILDEAQNWTLKDLKKMISRFHDCAKIIIIGNVGQCDLKNPSQSGFPRVVEFYKTRSYARVVKLTKNFRGIVSQDSENL